jgi:hypothetical protein
MMCNSIDSDNAKASDISNDHDYAYASDNANDKTRRAMIMLMLTDHNAEILTLMLVTMLILMLRPSFIVKLMIMLPMQRIGQRRKGDV